MNPAPPAPVHPQGAGSSTDSLVGALRGAGPARKVVGTPAPRRPRRPAPQPEEHRERHHRHRRRQRRRLTPPRQPAERRRHQLPHGLDRAALRRRHARSSSTAAPSGSTSSAGARSAATSRASISKGDPVIVHGALTTHEWESENGPRSKPRIKAFAVGPNLAEGQRRCSRADRSAARPHEPVDADAVASTSGVRGRAGRTRRCSAGTRGRPGLRGGAARRWTRWTPTTPPRSPRTPSCPGLGGSEARTQGVRAGDPAAPPPLARRRKAPKPSGSVHLHDGQCAQGARRQGDPRRRHPGVPARREDRRRRPERRRQVDRAQDHGRPGAALQR